MNILVCFILFWASPQVDWGKKAVRKVTEFNLENRNLLISLMTPLYPLYWRSNPGSHIYEINALPLSSVSSSLVKYHETSSQIKGIRKKYFKKWKYLLRVNRKLPGTVPKFTLGYSMLLSFPHTVSQSYRVALLRFRWWHYACCVWLD